MKHLNYKTTIILLSVSIFFSLTPTVLSTPAYVTVEENDKFTWEISFDETVYAKWVNDGGAYYFSTTDVFSYCDLYRGYRYEVLSVGPEEYFGTYQSHGVEVQCYLQVSSEALENNNWNQIGGGSWYIFRADDMNNLTYLLVGWAHRPNFIDPAINWAEAASELEIFLTNQYGADLTYCSVNYWMRGLTISLKFTGMESDIMFMTGYTREGVLHYYSAYYGIECMANVLTYQESAQDPQGQEISIPGYELTITLGVIFVLTTVFVKKKLRAKA